MLVLVFDFLGECGFGVLVLDLRFVGQDQVFLVLVDRIRAHLLGADNAEAALTGRVLRAARRRREEIHQVFGGVAPFDVGRVFGDGVGIVVRGVVVVLVLRGFGLCLGFFELDLVDVAVDTVRRNRLVFHGREGPRRLVLVDVMPRNDRDFARQLRDCDRIAVATTAPAPAADGRGTDRAVL